MQSDHKGLRVLGDLGELNNSLLTVGATSISTLKTLSFLMG